MGILCTACNPNYDMIGMSNGTSPEIKQRFKESREYNEKHGVVHLQMPED